ncbi:hypothetical protein OIU78_015789 [Salix suchowensis]|nr:hypothetical protein OIU78_015789 [Salix suchowensis]
MASLNGNREIIYPVKSRERAVQFRMWRQNCSSDHQKQEQSASLQESSDECHLIVRPTFHILRLLLKLYCTCASNNQGNSIILREIYMLYVKKATMID